MTFERRLARAFHLDETNWMRHANPWSVWTRYSVLPAISLAIWSRDWLGIWCIIPIIVAVLWLFANPLLFPAPKSTRNWASRSVLGERVYLNRDNIAIPKHHQGRLPIILGLVSGFGLMLSVWGAVVYSISTVVMGTLITYLGKSWFLDRMVWLYEDMKFEHPDYYNWDY